MNPGDMKKTIFTLLTTTALAGILAGCASQPVPQAINTGAGGYGSYLQGAVAELGGSYNTAQRAYLYTLAEDPDNITLRQRVFQMSLLEGDIPTAVRLVKTLPDEARTQTMPQLVLTLDAIKRNKPDEAQEHLSRASAMAPQLLHFTVMKDYLALAAGQSPTTVINRLQTQPVPQAMLSRRAYQVGRMNLKQGKVEEARQALEQAEQIEPGTVFTTRLLGELYERAGDTGRAAEVYNLFRNRNPNVPLFGEAFDRMAQKQKPAPFASTPEQDIAEVMFDFGLLVWVQGADGPARQILNLTLWLNDESDPYALYYAALIGEFGDRSGLSRARYQKLLADPRLSVAAGLRLAQLDFTEGKKDDAIRRLNNLMASNKRDSKTVQRALADTLFADKNFEAALVQYKPLVAEVDSLAPPQQVALLFAYGAALERVKRYDEAGTYLKKAVTIDPANPQILNYLGYMWVEQNRNIDEAFVLLKRANALAPNDGAITDSLGWAYHMMGKDQIALGYLERAAEQEPDDATVNEHLGDLYAKLGRTDEAYTQWRLALQLAGNDKELKARLENKLKAK
ncbi:MAG TPA: tetratricopeptide repeat protein [Alphaproteobacteria bacterium]|nr:tetratricopeptide repeat protein [Alphaproteobacteria bacterium]